MYFLTEEERRVLVGKLLPHARRHEVHRELRGWSWQEAPLAAPYDVRLGASEIASKYCATGRDVYLRRVLGVRAGTNRAMQEGAVLHGAVAEMVVRAKRALYSGEQARLAEALAEEWPEEAASGPASAEVVELRSKTAAIRAFEYHRLVSRVQDVLARQPRIGVDSLVALALPVTVEQQLDGTLLGLSAHLAVDALMAFAPVVYDLKFDRRRDFHRLSTTAYAMVAESLFEHPMDVGCTIYVRFEGDRVLLERDLHLIDDELRQWFLDERDERMRMVSEEIDPGRPEQCYDDCPYLRECRRG